MSDCALFLWQFFCLIATAAGWGVWVWLLTGKPAPRRHTAWLWCGLAGFCAHALVLQNLVYLDQPLARTAWLAFGVTLAGLAAGVRHGRKSVPSPGSSWKDVRLLCGVFFAVVVVQSADVLWRGPADYFGKGRYDQANYVVTAQFFVDRPFSSTMADVQLHPWIARALETKEERISQSVSHGALAVVSGTDCQQAYGAMTVFFVGLTGLAVVAWLRAQAIRRPLAAIAGAAAALGPALTTLQLDGYFSQTSTLFILPALAALLLPRGSLGRLQRGTAALLLAYWIGAYTEVAAVGVGLVIVLRLTATEPWRNRARDLAWIFGGALLVNPGFTVRLPAFLVEQWTRAQNPQLLAALFPDSGTWFGWGRLFLEPFSGQGARALIVTAGATVLGLILCAAVLLPRRRRGRLWATLAVPVALLAWLGLQPDLAKYPFAKLLAGFAPLWVGTAMLGLVAIGRLQLKAQVLLAALALGASAAGAWGQHARVLQREGILAELTSPAMHRARLEVGAHPERTYLVASDDPLVTQWLCYFARASEVYVNRRHVGDRIAPSQRYAFRQLPAAGTKLWWLDLHRAGPVENFAPACQLHVSGAETGTVSGGDFYLVRNNLHLDIERPSTTPAMEFLWLDLGCAPQSGGTAVELELVGPQHQVQRTKMTGPRLLRFHLPLTPGPNHFVLRLKPAPGESSPKDTVIVQALSLDPLVAVELASDPAPVDYVP